MLMDEHYISVALCTYNGERFIKEQLESILNQNIPVNEIIIGDDGSTDNTIEIIEGILEKSGIEYQIICNENNLGFCKNFENVIAHTKGDIIFLSDQDDVWRTNKVEKMISHFDQNEKCFLVFSDAYLVDSEMNRLPGSLWEAVYYKKNRFKFQMWMDLLLSGNYVTGATMAFRRELFKMAVPFPQKSYHDAWLAIYAALYGEIEEESEQLIYYRQHGHNLVGAKKEKGLKEIVENKILLGKRAIKEQYEDHKKMYEFYHEIYLREKEKMKKTDIKKVKSCLDAQQKFCEISGDRKIYSLKIIAQGIIRGKYKKYCRKPIGFCGCDVLYCFFNKR